jgi:hypothetical protein
MMVLSIFISKLSMRGLPFFKLLKKQDRFKWTKEAKEVFEEFKWYLTSPPTLVALEPHEVLHLYKSATSNMVSTTIVVKRRESGRNRKIRYLVYFISNILGDSNTHIST